MPDQLRVGLIGCGAVSELLYAKALKRLESDGLHTVVLVDPDPQRTGVLGVHFPSAGRYASTTEALRSERLDLAVIASPHEHHESQVLECLAAGAGVLCEKPMATSVEACDRMIYAAAGSGRILAIGHFRRFYPSCQIIKELVAAGALGAVKSFRALEGETYSWPARSASFFRRQQAGGGVLIDAGAHTLDLLLWWLGDVADLRYHDDAMGGVECNSLLHLRMRSGAWGTVRLSRDWPLPNQYLLDCERGWLKYTCDVVDRFEWGWHEPAYAMQSHLVPAAATAPRTASLMDAFENQLRNVAGAIAGRQPLVVPGAEARRVVSLIDRCYQSRSLVAMPWLPDDEWERARSLAGG